MIQPLSRFRYQFTGNEVAEPGPVRLGTVLARDVPMYPGGNPEGMLRVRWDDDPDGTTLTKFIHERHVTEV